MVHRILKIFLVSALFFVSGAGPAYGSIDIQDRESEGALGVDVFQDRTSTYERNRSTSPTRAAPPPTSNNASTDRGSGGNGRSPFVVPVPTTLGLETWANCLSIGVRRMIPDACSPELSPAPDPDSPAAPEPQPQVVIEPVTITITSSDLLELIPSSPQILMDRGPFGLKNAHTNFFASDHEPQTITQTMFGQEVTITATPVEYRWDYGDGNTLVTDMPGHPVDVFNTETDTSHQYEETGLHTVQLTTVFEGTFQVDGGEVQEVSSPVTQEADPVEIRIYRAVTRNVDQTCVENPNAWGCDLPQ